MKILDMKTLTYIGVDEPVIEEVWDWNVELVPWVLLLPIIVMVLYVLLGFTPPQLL